MRVKRLFKNTWFYVGLLLIIFILICVFIYGLLKPLPDGVSYEGELHAINNAAFYYDLTYEENNEWVADQSIYDEILQVIDRAEDWLILDMFLFNDYHDREIDMPELSGQLTDAIIQKKQDHPDLEVIFITDEFNLGYGSHSSKHLDALKENNVHVVISDLTELRDGKPIYSTFYRTFFQWFGRGDRGWLPHPLSDDAPSLTARSYLKMLNLKANHRKLVATEQEAFITSANPHDGSGYYSNIGFKVEGAVIKDVWEAEKAVIDFSTDEEIPFPEEDEFIIDDVEGDPQLYAQHLTEGKIKNHIIEEINATAQDETIYIGMYLLSKSPIIDALVEASQRQVDVRIILDPNNYSFGQETTGLPNRPSAAEMFERSDGDIQIRWFHTEKNQFHTKLMLIRGNEESVMLGGSSNFTRRNLDDFNLDASIKIIAENDTELAMDVYDYFQKIWNNEDDILYTDTIDEYYDDLALWKRFTYRLQRWTYLTTY
ncbi:phospholipase [Salipaludibacillus keqinensis]|uniref:Phospholipase n=1 Tax=Salipaludibacillus keqinensis TaxID=2045207 RepID=A0A323TI98_9BACI|nr:phospholipase D family protein [Salipaludibacillus keqinensis]PYZ93906.1 phospholipase [Salipaludibacillus keqinensis]